jgi:3-oxoacyl-[acyl-carrier protein] reductase
MDISNAKVIVTGGNSGIGYEIAKVLRQNGAQVVICGRDEQKIQKAASELDVVGFKADVSNEQDVKDLCAFAINSLGGLNVLINNAGIGYYAPLTDTSIDNFTRIWETNVKGAFVAGREAAIHFITQKTGNIINISSTAGQRGFANGSAYVASKFALSGLTECWRGELRQHNIRVMQINPSEVTTDFGPKLGFEPTNVDKKLKASEIAHVVLAMLSMNDVGFITDASVWATNP